MTKNVNYKYIMSPRVEVHIPSENTGDRNIKEILPSRHTPLKVPRKSNVQNTDVRR